MSLIDRYNNNKPDNAKANTIGGDKTPLEPDGGLNLSTDGAKITKARNGELGSGLPAGAIANGFESYTPGNSYSTVVKKD
jgi:hypothetical protein